MVIVLLILITIVLIIYSIVKLTKKIKRASKSKNTTTNDDATTAKTTAKTTAEIDATYIRDNTTGVIRRIDNKPISDEEVPYLIELGTQHAIEREQQSKNPKFHRTEREEELSFQFMMNHGEQIEKRTASFEDCNRLAYKENDINKKIELLQKTILLYEEAKKWFYKTKGGTIYFQDYYEYQHNSQNDCFSYIDTVKEYLKDCIFVKNYIMPKILYAIKSNSDGILQKDIYQHLPDASRGDVQRVIRNLESQGLITREKSKNSYLLTIKETQ